MTGYVTRVLELADGCPLNVEQRLVATSVGEGVTCVLDVWWLNERTATIHIVDLKYGRVGVQARHNWQLICYLAAVLDTLPNGSDLSLAAHLEIYQPRAIDGLGTSRTWRTERAAELRTYVNRLEHAYSAKNPGLYAGPHCGQCPASQAGQCPAARDRALLAVEWLGVPQLDTPDGDRLGAELALLSDVMAAAATRRTALEAEAAARIAAGQRVPGFAMKAGRGSTQWTGDRDELLTLARMLQIDIAKPIECITPNQALQRGLPKEIVNAFVTKFAGKAKLCRIDTNEAIGVFND
jgi:hypothetical protein